jgi:hypothetical protein
MAITAAAKDGNGTGGEQDVSTPDDGRHQADTTTTVGRNHADGHAHGHDEHGGLGTVNASTSGCDEGGCDEAKHGHGNDYTGPWPLSSPS